MSMNNPSFPSSQGDRRIEDSRLPKVSHQGTAASPLAHISHAPGYQVAKTLTRQIAPAPGTQGLAGINKPMTAHQITTLNPAVHKKEIHKVPLSLTATTQVTSGASGSTISNIIPVQLSGTATSSVPHAGSTLHVPNVSSIVRGAVPGQTTLHAPAPYSHLPRALTGVVAASTHVRGSAISIQRQSLPTTSHLPPHATALPLNIRGQVHNVIPQMMRPGTPPTNRSGSPVISIGTAPPTDSHRTSISLHNVTTASNTPSIQITLQTSRSNPDVLAGKTAYQSPKVPLNMSTQPKVVMTHSLPPVLQHPTLAAKGNRGQPLGSSSLSTVTVALSTTTVTIPIISSGTTSSSIPIAKVPPQRQAQQAHTIPVVSHTVATSHPDPRGAEPNTYQQPQPAHAQLPGHTSGGTAPPTGHAPTGQPASSLFLSGQAAARGSPAVSTVGSNTGHSDTATREQLPLNAMPFVPPYMLSPDNPFYQQLMRYQVAAVAQAQARPGLLPTTQTTGNLAASLQSVSHNVTTGASVRFNHPNLMVMPDSLRQTTPQAFHATSSEAVKVTASVDGAGVVTPQVVTQTPVGISVPSLVGGASSMYSPQTHLHGPLTSVSSTPISNPSASPRPSILRKRTNEGISAVKKQLSMTSMADVHSPRPEPRPDSTPQSNMSSPKTPASGESQSSTDTALSSEATTPTQPSNDLKVKQEPGMEPHENGFSNTPEASPRKRRKQLLQATEEIRDPPLPVVNEFDKLIEACIKEEVEEEEEEDDDDTLTDEEKMDTREEYVDDEGVRWTLEKCRSGVAMLNFYNISWKPRNNHFNRYSDVKPKDERRPTVNELSNQKGVVQKASGWKLFHMAAQMDDLVELEQELNKKIVGLQTLVAPDAPMKHSVMEDESAMLHDLTQGNIQRCKLISDQLSEAKSAMLKVLDHKKKVSEIVSKHQSKRPIKKKERT